MSTYTYLHLSAALGSAIAKRDVEARHESLPKTCLVRGLCHALQESVDALIRPCPSAMWAAMTSKPAGKHLLMVLVLCLLLALSVTTLKTSNYFGSHRPRRDVLQGVVRWPHAHSQQPSSAEVRPHSVDEVLCNGGTNPKDARQQQHHTHKRGSTKY